MDPLTARAVEHYHTLLRDERALVQELEERFVARMREAKLTFGGRVLCPFPRPNLVSPGVYEQIRGVCRRIFQAIEKAEARLGPDLWDRVDLTPEERELVAIDPGLQAQLAHLAPRFLRDHVGLPVRGAERGEPGRDRLRRGPGGRLPRSPYREEVPGALRPAPLPRARARAGDAGGLLPRGGRARGAATHRHRGLRGRAHPHGALPLPGVLRVARVSVARLRSPRAHLRGRRAALRGPADRHRIQAAPGERVPGAHRASCSRFCRPRATGPSRW